MLTSLSIRALVLGVFTLTWAGTTQGAEFTGAGDMKIVHQNNATPVEVLAAREVQRYVYLRTGELLPMTAGATGAGSVISIRVDDSLDAEAHRLRTVGTSSARSLELTGGSEVALLYAAYRFAEHLGVRFALHGDVVPDARIELLLPDLDETHEPIFALRGILPFHDFTEGPDWWEVDDYKAYLAQLAKLRMNFLGMHCYPEGGVGPEPLVWIGLPDDVAGDGEVLFSYPSRWASTDGGAWGYAPLATSEFAAGAGLLFADDAFGPSVTVGHRPLPANAEGANEVFNRAGPLLDDVFAFGRPLGLQYCLGTEAPLTIPEVVQARLRERGLDPAHPETINLVYQGIFERIERAHGADYYWLWTPESWTWSGTTKEQVEATIADIRIAADALARLSEPMQLATCGWVLGPPGARALFDEVLDRGVPLSCINRQVGFDPVEPAFAAVEGRSTWAIPWLEDDPAMIIPQLWAGRLRRDAADAAAYGCDGLIGIHWRTRILDPNLGALAQAAWEQDGWNTELGEAAPRIEPRTKDVHEGGATADYANNAIAGTDEQRVYQTCRWNVDGYVIDVPAGMYRVRLQFCEVHYREAGQRVFGVKLQDEQVAEGLDVFARVGANAALDLVFDGVEVGDAGLVIDFTREVEYPFIAGIEIVAVGAGGEEAALRRINCGGESVGGYEADLPALGSFPELGARARDLPCDDFYSDWAQAQFGTAVGKELAALFLALDGGEGAYQHGKRSHLPRPSDWRAGPGGIVVNAQPWAREQQRYAFVAEMERLRPRVMGAANRERFDYWLNNFRYLRAVGEAGCRRGELDALVQRLRAMDDASLRRRVVREEALPVRLRLARVWEEMLTLQLAVVSTPGELGTIANLEQHVRMHNRFLSAHDEQLAAWLGEALPEATRPSRAYHGEARLIVPTVRTMGLEGERLRLRLLALSAQPVKRVVVQVRPLGEGAWREIEAACLGRRVYECELPALGVGGLEYVAEAVFAGGKTQRWPATESGAGQTVVGMPRE